MPPLLIAYLVGSAIAFVVIPTITQIMGDNDDDKYFHWVFGTIGWPAFIGVAALFFICEQSFRLLSWPGRALMAKRELNKPKEPDLYELMVTADERVAAEREAELALIEGRNART